MAKLSLLALPFFFLSSCGSDINSEDNLKQETLDSSLVLIDSNATEVTTDTIPSEIKLDLITLSIDDLALSEHNKCEVGYFYSSEDSVLFFNDSTGFPEYISSGNINGKELNLKAIYRDSEGTNEYSCCDEWSGEEACSFYVLVELNGKTGLLAGKDIFQTPDLSNPDKSLKDSDGQNIFAVYQAPSIRSCPEKLFFIRSDSSTIKMLFINQNELLISGGAWGIVKELFYREGNPVLLLSNGVDGSYSYDFYEIKTANGNYIANHYYETSVQVGFDEFDNGFDFDSALHEQYRNDNEDQDF